MVDISKIFEKDREKEPSQETKEKQKEEIKENILKEAETKAKSPDSNININEIYKELYSIIKELYIKKFTKEHFKRLDEIFELIKNSLDQKEFDFFNLFFSDYPDLDDYLFFHVVNVAILSTIFGNYINLDNLKDIFISALFHDIGLVNFLDLIREKRKFKDEEYKKIKTHPEIAIKILKNFELSSDILKIVEQVYERIDGGGYPHNIKEKDFILQSQLISICNKYEALTHRRPYRDKYNIFYVIKIIIEDKGFVSYNIVRNFINRVGILPPTTSINLNTKEKGIIIGSNPGHPLRPKVKIFLDSSDRKLDIPKDIDLLKNNSLYIVF